MATVLVMANETLGGRGLLEAVRARAQQAQQAGEDVRFHLVVPQNRPSHGAIVYAEAVQDSAQARVDLARQFMAEEGIEVQGEVGDPDPFLAAMDAIDEHHPDELIVSTHPTTVSGWMRRDLVERLRDASGLPVTHVEVDMDREGLPVPETLVIANRTLTGEELMDRLKAKAAETERRLFLVVVPQESGLGNASRQARERLGLLLRRLREAGLVCAGFISGPDPYVAAMNAVRSFHVSDILISTHPETRSGWMRGDLIERVRESTGLPVEHVVVEREPAGARS